MYARLGELSKQRRKREAAEAEEFGYDIDESEYEEDMYYENLDINKYNSCMKAYITQGLAMRVAVKHPVCSAFMNACILLAGLMVGLSSYKEITENHPKLIGNIEWFILVVFTLEFLMKVAMDPLRPWKYFLGRDRAWNLFDFVIIVVMLFPTEDESIGEYAAFVRLFRLARLLKILAKYAELRMILVGLAAGMKSSFFILLLLLLSFYLFATAGLFFFAEGDSQEFSSYPRAFQTLFRMATLEDWSDVMYINYYGCLNYPSGGSINYYDQSNNTLPLDPYWRLNFTQPCVNKVQKGLSAVYFHFFIIVASLIVLSMFVGSIAIAMTEIMSKMRLERAKRQEERVRSAGAKASNERNYDLVSDACLKVEDISKCPLSGRIRCSQIKSILDRAINKRPARSTFYLDEMQRLNPVAKMYFCIGMLFRKIAYSQVFSWFVALVICVAGLLVGLQTDNLIPEDTTAVETFIFVVFLLELVFKLIAEIFQPWRFFMDPWNRFDFLIVVCGVPGLPTGQYALVLRLLRLLRVLKLLKTFPELQVLVIALLKSFASIGWISMLLGLFLYMSAIMCIMFFGRNDPWHFGNVHLAMMTLFRVVTLEDWTDIMYIAQKGCDKVQAFPYDDPSPGHRELCTDPSPTGMWSFLFFFLFVMLGNYVLLSLFIGIIAAEMEAAMRAQMETKELTRQVDDYCKTNEIRPWRKKLLIRLFWLMNELRPSEGIDFEVMLFGLQLAGERMSNEEAKIWFETCAAARPPPDNLSIYDFVVFLTNLPWRGGPALITKTLEESKADSLNTTHQLQALAMAEREEAEMQERRRQSSVQALELEKMGKRDGCAACWARFGKWNFEMIQDPLYSNFMLGIVVLAGLVVAMQAGYDDEDNQFLIALDLIIWIIFTIEVVQKVLAHPFRPYKFFIDPLDWKWNWFDFSIQVLSTPGVYPAAKALRLFRLARLIKIINKIPSLKVIVKGLLSGLGSVVYILLLIVIIFYIYAVLGVVLFKHNDPFHFPDIATSFETLTRCATMEDWTDIWYINFFGCDYFTSIGGSSYRNTNSTIKIGAREGDVTYCHSKAQPILASIYFISFMAIAAFILLSLFVGTILISTMDAVQEISDNKKETVKRRRVEAKNHAQATASSLPMRKRKQTVVVSMLHAWSSSKHKEIQRLGLQIKETLHTKMQSAHSDGYIDAEANLDWAEVKNISNPCAKVYFILSFHCATIRDNQWFQAAVNLAILIASIQVGVQASGAESTLYTDEETWRQADLALNGIFTFELVVKMIAEGLRPLNFFRDGWNRLDFVIVACAYSPAIGGVALLFRMIRLLRVLKVIRVFPELRMLVAALLNAEESVLFVSLLMFLVFFTFAIFSVTEFKTNDPWRFGDLHTSLMTLFRVATGDDWTDVMYTAQFGCKLYASDVPSCETNQPRGWWAVLFFIFFHIMGGLVFLNLFIGVITVGMADAMEERDDEQYTLRRVARLKHTSKMSEVAIAAYKRAFYALDLTKDNRLDVHDLKWALEALFFCPSEEDVHDLIYKTASSMITDPRDLPEHGDSELDLYDFIHAMENWEAILKLDSVSSVKTNLPSSHCESATIKIAAIDNLELKTIERQNGHRNTATKQSKTRKKDKKRPSPTSTAVTSLTKKDTNTRTRAIV